MISFEEAQRLILRNVPAPAEETLPVFKTLGCVVSADVFSTLALPLFDNSAMDGFALRSGDVQAVLPGKPALLKIQGVVKAGDHKTAALRVNECCRIMTGAPLPIGADTVIPVEQAIVNGAFLCVAKFWPKHKNIRHAGEEMGEGDVAVPKNSVVNPGTVGFLAALGITELKVFKKPKISIIATGTELVPPGQPLRPGKIYDSNTSMIHAATLEMGISPVMVKRLDDNPRRIKRVMNHALKESDITILMGGVSVGDYDHVRTLLGESGVEKVFWKVSQKPGKPMYFGTKEGRLVFGLPGNPASVFTCFYEYVYPAIRKFMGHHEVFLPAARFPLRESVKGDPVKSVFLKARIHFLNGHSEVSVLPGQSSHMISSLCQANGIVALPPSDQVLEKGEKPLVHALPYIRGESAREN